jgi:hypothetical protein
VKKYLLATAFAAALSVSAPAFAQPTGYFGIGDTQANVKVAGVEDDTNEVIVSGALAFPVNETVFAAGNVNFTDVDGNTSGGGDVHVGGKFGNGLAAGFVGLDRAGSSSVWSGGVEGQYYATDAVTLAGTLGYIDANDADASAWVANAEGRYFVTDNFRLNANVGYLDADTSAGDGNGWLAGLGGEYQFGGTPLSLFGGYTYGKSDDADLEANLWTFGFRVNFNGSLKDRDRSGASLTGVSALASGLGF